MNASEFKAARKSKSLSQRELASLLGVSYSAVTKWESGANPVPAWVGERLKDRRKSVIVEGLSADDVARLEKLAANKGLSPDPLVGELIKNFIRLSIAVGLANHFFPSETRHVLTAAWRHILALV